LFSFEVKYEADCLQDGICGHLDKQLVCMTGRSEPGSVTCLKMPDEDSGINCSTDDVTQEYLVNSWYPWHKIRNSNVL